MTELFPPFLVYIIGAVLLPLVPKGGFRSALALVVPVVSAWLIWTMPEGLHGQMSLAGWDITLLRVDKLSMVFGLVFSLAAFLALLYASHVRDTVQLVSALLYAGAAIGAVFAGDLISLFIFWEGTAIASVFLIWARRTEGAYATGLRYLVIQVGSGVLLLAGIVLVYLDTGSITFNTMTLGTPGTWAILLAFGIKAAFPLLHGWLQDAYPAATITGTVFLSAFTTKLAIYALARGFPGTEILIYIGAIMAVFPVFYAVLENDLRRVLVHSLNIQLGFMVVGVGIGTELALAGTAAHAVVHILYKSLLLMGIGAVLFRTGTAKASELGGLCRTMPLTTLFCVIGALASAAFPFFSAFVTKSLIISEAAHEHHYYVWGALYVASAGVVFHSGLKVPYMAFFAQDSGKRPKEAPAHMLLAMAIAAFLCVFIGINPGPLYALLPYTVEYEVYTTSHIFGQLKILFFATLAFALLMRKGIYPAETRAVILESDVIYRKWLPGFVATAGSGIIRVWDAKMAFWQRKIQLVIDGLYASHGPEGQIAKVWPTGSMVLWIAILLGVTLLVNFFA